MSFKEPLEALTVKVNVSTMGRSSEPCLVLQPCILDPLEPTAFRRAVWCNTHPGTEPTA